ncbi:P-loop containing nucleoside triphosphate hydrolase protein [Cunninghamella echinulata]|nr:P-loop containing nucleoside triphosphate hydrolase protein [Cunninghamella echinulata]
MDPTSSKLSKPTIQKKQKRAPWDLRGKIDDLGEKASEQSTKIDSVRQLTEELESTVGSAASETQEALDRVYELEALVKSKKQQQQLDLEKLRHKHQQENRQLEENNFQYERQLGGMDVELNNIKSKTSLLLKEWEMKTSEISDLQKIISTTSANLTERELQLTARTKQLQETDATLGEKQNKLEHLIKAIENTRKRRYDIDTQLLEEEKLRRKLHNTIQELKGNIRVFCRMRPSLAKENNVAQVKFFNNENGEDKMELSEQVSSTLGKISTKSYPFTFDKIFTPEHDQLKCFEEISQLVQSALDGYNVCIFAYGQTGSGKTYTMQGSNDKPANMGMIPRAVHQIYEVAQMLSERGWDYSMEGQFLEIYNESIHDLLGEVSDYGKIKHEIRHEKNGRTIVTDMTTVKLDSPLKVKTMLRKANQNRSTGATLLNERSSRSHSVFILQLTGHNTVTGEKTSGVLNLIDLAGSERLSSSGSTGDRLTETKAINKSLSCLGDVIHALASNKEGSYIPYRNSKLTYLLQNSLGGNSKTLMFVNISPLAEHFGETLCSLRFATKVNSCRIGTARKLNLK